MSEARGARQLDAASDAVAFPAARRCRRLDFRASELALWFTLDVRKTVWQDCPVFFSDLRRKRQSNYAVKEGLVRRYKIGVGLAIALFVAIAGTAFATTANKSDNVTLTLWHNYGDDSDAVAAKSIVAAFEKLHPNITIKLVSQPGSNYFALLQAASISKTGPDLAVQWTGVFDLKYQNYLVNLKPYLSAAQIAKLNAAP